MKKALKKLAYRLDNFIYHISFFMMLWEGYVAWTYSQNEKPGMALVAFLMSFFFGRLWLKARREIAFNNERLKEIDKPELKAENITKFSTTGFWHILREKYSDLSDVQILHLREKEMIDMLKKSIIKGKVSDHFEINTYTPIGDTNKLITDVVPKTDSAKQTILELHDFLGKHGYYE